MISRQRIDASLDIGEILSKQRDHICVETRSVRYRRIGMGARPRCRGVPTLRCLPKAAQGEAVSNIPGDPRQLARAERNAHGKAGERTRHAMALIGDAQPSCQPPEMQYRVGDAATRSRRVIHATGT